MESPNYTIDGNGSNLLFGDLHYHISQPPPPNIEEINAAVVKLQKDLWRQAIASAGEVSCPVDLDRPIRPVSLQIKAGVKRQQDVTMPSRRRSEFEKPFGVSMSNVNLDQLFKLAKQNAVQEAASKSINIQAKEVWIDTHSNSVGTVGHAGMGKTTLAKMLTQNIMDKVVLAETDFIIYLPLKLIDFKRETSFVQFLLSGLNSGWKSEPERDRILLDTLNRSNVVIVLDGLDEAAFDKTSRVGVVYEDSLSTADVFLKNILAGRLLCKAKKLLTSRPSELYDLYPDYRPHFIVEILGLSIQAQDDLCDQICGPELSPKVKQNLHDHSELSAYSHIPIYCIMTIVCLFQNILNKAEDQIMSMTDVLFFVLSKYMRSDHLRDNPCKLNNLASLAWSGLSCRQVVFTIEELQEAGIVKDEFQAFLNTFIDDTPTLRFRILEGDKRISFSHLIWQEFFSACYLIFLVPLDEFSASLPSLKHYNSRVVVKFMYGLCNVDIFHKAKSMFSSLKLNAWQDKCNTMMRFVSDYTRELTVTINQKHILCQVCSWVHESKNTDVLKAVKENLPERIDLLGMLKSHEVVSICYVLREDSKLRILNAGKKSKLGTNQALRFAGDAFSRFLDGTKTLFSDEKLEVNCISLWQTQVLQRDLVAIKPLLSKLQILSFLECDLSPDFVVQLAQLLKDSNIQLELLDLSVNDLGNEGAEAISKVLAKTQRLYLRNCGITDTGVAHISKECSLLTNQMTKLDLSFNEIADSGAMSISHCLHNIQCLNLHDCEITETGIHALGDGLNSCEKISLTISGNVIGDKGIAAFQPHWHKFESIGLADCGLSENCVDTIENKLQELTLATTSIESLPQVRGLYRQTLRRSFRRPASQSTSSLN